MTSECFYYSIFREVRGVYLCWGERKDGRDLETWTLSGGPLSTMMWCDFSDFICWSAVLTLVQAGKPVQHEVPSNVANYGGDIAVRRLSEQFEWRGPVTELDACNREFYDNHALFQFARVPDLMGWFCVSAWTRTWKRKNMDLKVLRLRPPETPRWTVACQTQFGTKSVRP